MTITHLAFFEFKCVLISDRPELKFCRNRNQTGNRLLLFLTETGNENQYIYIFLKLVLI